MKVLIIKSFPYAHDGNKIELLPADKEHDVRDELVPGLTAAGYVAKPAMAMKAPENTALKAAPENKLATDTLPQRDRRKR